jgi:hypothetical protein
VARAAVASAHAVSPANRWLRKCAQLSERSTAPRSEISSLVSAVARHLGTEVAAEFAGYPLAPGAASFAADLRERPASGYFPVAMGVCAQEPKDTKRSNEVSRTYAGSTSSPAWP